MSVIAQAPRETGHHFLFDISGSQHVRDPAKSLSSHTITDPYQYDTEQDRNPRLFEKKPKYYPRPVLPPVNGTMAESRVYLTQVLHWEFYHRGLKCEAEYIRAVTKCCITPYNLRRLVIAGAGLDTQQDWGKTVLGANKFGLKQLENVLVYYGFSNSKGLMPAARLFRTAVIRHIERTVMRECEVTLKARRDAEEAQRNARRHRFGPLTKPLKKVKLFIVEKFGRYLF